MSYEGRWSDVDEDPSLAVRERELPDSVVSLVDDYDRIVDGRDRYLWRWLSRLFPEFRLSCVEPLHVRQTHDAKLFASIFVAVVDDVAERDGDRETLEEAAKIPFDHQTANLDRDGVRPELLAFLQETWAAFSETIGGSPRLSEFDEILSFDLKQVVTAIEYSALANQHLDLVSEYELCRYDVNNMMVFVYADIDLLFAPAFDRSDLSTLRRLVTHAQRLARIGNWITTWRRELTEGDCSSAVVISALERDLVSIDDLRAIQRDPSEEHVAVVSQAIEEHDVVSRFFRQWHHEYRVAKRLAPEIETVDVPAYLNGFETVFEYHLASEGLK
ncbi:hypothetical protein [Natrononativus amylolyticus]|uniref:hypothetical protein n=1 Tax=Natrononativus amylolyticus TaxID=2963434 RepID=UPI0020CE23E4|nr:hypothetical protein [Natrononativus amylolyticus]